MDNKPTRVLLIEDNPGDARLIREMLREATGTPFELECAGRLSSGLERLAEGGISAVLLDLGLPDSQGLETLVKVQAEAPQVPIIVLTGLGDETMAANAVGRGAQDYLVKGQVDSSMLMRAIRYAMERKRIEKRLWDSMSNFYKVINDNPDGIIITNRQGIVRYVNPAAESLFCRKSEDFKGEQFGFPITLGDITEVDINHKAGEIVVAEMRVAETVWYDEISYLISLHDITERKKAHLVQERLTRQLQAQVSELEAFSYGIAHDLRSPLVSIEGFSRLLREDLESQKVENVAEDIRLLESGVRKMQAFLNSTLEYSRSGRLIKRTDDVSFGEIVNEAITEFNGQISAIGATVSLAKTFPKICVDRSRIKQVLANLIQNSIKYRDKTVPLKIEIGHYPSGNEIVFFVRDNGPGIDASDAEKVFALFYRGTADGEGSGIGLAVVRKVIEAHGGRIWIQEGQSGKGTTMCFTLPEPGDTDKGDNNGKD